MFKCDDRGLFNLSIEGHDLKTLCEPIVSLVQFGS